jgi:hypothetical protein
VPLIKIAFENFTAGMRARDDDMEMGKLSRGVNGATARKRTIASRAYGGFPLILVNLRSS